MCLLVSLPSPTRGEGTVTRISLADKFIEH
ncbi:protein of unknown function [Bradyrhizobium vignae]|uniref:Uncharacterized protein n=1 Tax=Bradyrhizobium vignae TaxID=1549949 RepID=A0A2U3Q7R5_9BRAD|nr:protein of unknown function [Bradyrhizobium vignae]